MGLSKLQTDIRNKDLTITPTDELRKLIKQKAPVIVTSLRDVKILIARTLLKLQKDEISAVDSKAIIYCCNSWITTWKETELSERLKVLEDKIGITYE